MKTNLIVGFVMLLCGAATRIQAQGTIAYYNPEPDLFYLASGSIPLDVDVNADGTKDIRFFYSSNVTMVVPLRGGSALSAPTSYPLTTLLSAGDFVGAATGTNVWGGQQPGFGSELWGPRLTGITGSSSGGQFYRRDGYFGFQLVEGGQSYYGWMHVDFASGPIASPFIKEWAYNTAAGQSITVGQVPEPASISLLGLGCLLLWRVGRRRVAG